MNEKLTLGQVLAHLDALGGDLAKDKPLVDLAGIIPVADHHQTVIFIRSPYPGALAGGKVQERIVKLLTSVNRPDTIKADVYTVQGANVKQGWQPTLENAVIDGKEVHGPMFNPDWLIGAMPKAPWVLQITVDVVHPSVIAQALNLGSGEEWTEKEVEEVKEKAAKKYVNFNDMVVVMDDPDPNHGQGPPKTIKKEDF